MALITCPECGKEVSSRASMCPNCGCPIVDVPVTESTTQYKAKITNCLYSKKFNRWLLEADVRSLDGEFQEGDTVSLCDAKGCVLATTILSTYFSLPNVTIVTFGFDGLHDDIAKATAYVVKTVQTPRSINISNQVTCPKCGSNQIQIVRRNYSFWTGFMTNKVDRVCANCMHKF